MIESQKNTIPLIALVAVLAMAPVAPEAANILFLGAGGLALLLAWPGALAELKRPIVVLPLVGLALVGLAYGISAGVEGLSGLLYFAPLLAIWPLLGMLRGSTARDYRMLLGILALCGVSGAAIMVIIEVLATGRHRAGSGIANPIHFADVALLVGFLALIGVAFARSWWRLLYAAAPIMAIIAVALSGTRGAFVAVVAMVFIAAVCAIAVKIVNWRLALAVLVGLAVLGGLILALGGSQVPGVARVLSDISEVMTNGMPTDNSTNLRTQMYLGGWRAFLDAPIVGHGPIAFTSVADGLADFSFGGAPHLHNDLLDMAASAGVLGLVAYVLFLAAPIVEALRAPPSKVKPWNIVLATTLVSGFFVMGLTNAMFGILNITTVFAAICVVTGLLASAPDRPRADTDAPAP